MRPGEANSGVQMARHGPRHTHTHTHTHTRTHAGAHEDLKILPLKADRNTYLLEIT